MSGYWVIVASIAIGALAGTVALSRRLAYHPAHAAAPRQLEPVPPIGSMSLADEQTHQLGRVHRQYATWGELGAAARSVRVLHADPWGVPPVGEWTDRLLAELYEAPTILDQLEPDEFRRALAADATAHAALLETETRLYLLELADRSRTYLAALRGHL